MSPTLTIAKREVTALFFSPVAYLVLAIFALITGVLFYFVSFSPGNPAGMRNLFNWIVWLLVFLAPAISMRLLSEEYRGGSIEMLMTAPVTDTQVVLGKWLGAMGFFLTLLVPVLIQVGVLEYAADPDYGPILSGLVGIVLVGGLYLAIGLLVSALTDSQLIAFLMTALVAGFLTVGAYLLLMTIRWLPPWVGDALDYVNVNQQFDGFGKGLVDIQNLVYFLSGIALFLFAAVVALQSRRWR